MYLISSLNLLSDAVVGAAVVGAADVGAAVVGAALVGAPDVGAALVGAADVGAALVGAAVVGAALVPGAAVVGAAVVGAAVVPGGAVVSNPGHPPGPPAPNGCQHIPSEYINILSHLPLKTMSASQHSLSFWSVMVIVLIISASLQTIE
jgi:hypothetical protein